MPDLVELLSSQPEPLYAVLDAARDLRARDHVFLSKQRYACLYREEADPELEFVAPYLVHLPPNCRLLQQIAAEGWGKSWGIFLTCNQPFEAVWHQLRRLLMVRLEGLPKPAYFRFYDPRVLRSFLPIADAAQWQECFGPISSFLMESETPDTMVRFPFQSGAGRRTEAIAVQCRSAVK